jgi:hypothetical protein
MQELQKKKRDLSGALRLSNVCIRIVCSGAGSRLLSLATFKTNAETLLLMSETR